VLVSAIMIAQTLNNSWSELLNVALVVKSKLVEPKDLAWSWEDERSWQSAPSRSNQLRIENSAEIHHAKSSRVP